MYCEESRTATSCQSLNKTQQRAALKNKKKEKGREGRRGREGKGRKRRKGRKEHKGRHDCIHQV